MLATILTDIADVATGIAALLTATGLLLGQWVIYRRLTTVKNEITTANGITMAVLAERAEGRRIERDVTSDDRTVSETGYVDRLHQEKPANE